jgi:hypothetical protein
MQRFNGVVQDATGRAVPNAIITVFTAGVTNPLPNIYVAVGSKISPSVSTNPFQADVLGNYSFAAPDGTYDIQISGGGIPTKILPNVNFFDGGITYPSPMLGTVTSVSLTTPSIFTVSGSPVTGSGTLGLTLATQAKNTILAGPTTGADATPTMRAMVGADLPSMASYGIYGSSNTIPQITVDAYGRVSGCLGIPVSIPFTAITSGLPTTYAGYGIADAVGINTANEFTKAQNTALVTLTGTSVTPDVTAGNIFYLNMTGNTTLSNATGTVTASRMTIIFKQGGSGGYTISYGTTYKFPNGTVAQPDATLGAISKLDCWWDSTDSIWCCDIGKKYS